MTKRIAGLGCRKQKELYIRYASRHPDKRPKGRKLKRIRKALYSKMDRKWDKMRSSLNELMIDITRMRRPNGFNCCAMSPMMRWK
jgi:hypothetical protein